MRLILTGLLVSTSAFAQFAFGLKGGAPLTDFFHAVDNFVGTFRTGSTPFILGPTIEMHFPAGFGVEFDALYRRFHYDASSNLVDVVVNGSASNAWEFPILVKYRTPGVIFRPFLNAGFAFDHWSGVRQLIQIPSSLGTTKTILLSTHILQEVQAVCSRVLVINEGRIVFDGTVEDMEGAQHDMDRRFRELTGAAKSRG